NRITFVESGWSPAADGAVAVTERQRNTGVSPQRFTEADILLNGEDESWATDGNVHRYDVQTTVTHELGHALGLQHSARPEATMYFAARPGVTFARNLAPDDVAGVCFLYPSAATP